MASNVCLCKCRLASVEGAVESDNLDVIDEDEEHLIEQVTIVQWLLTCKAGSFAAPSESQISTHEELFDFPF